jgi:3-deoxy-D-manno-octulosonate 8-phosphate phosphatase (KDO 8-P phosphatase)
MARRFSKETKAAIESLELLAFDVDGVLTDGNIYLDQNGKETKQFNTKDGLGIELAIKAGLHVALISGRSSGAVRIRAKELGVDLVYQGVKDKRKVLRSILRKLKLPKTRSAFMGDDLPDLQLKDDVAVFVSPRDAVGAVAGASHVTTRNKGGKGAVREWIDLVLSFKNNVKEA